MKSAAARSLCVSTRAIASGRRYDAGASAVAGAPGT